MSTQIKDALARLDVTNDAHWTTDGLPRIETVKFLSGNQNLTRDDITKAAPGFARHNATLDTTAPAQGGDPAPSSSATEHPANAAPAAAAPAAVLVQAQDGGANGQVQQEAAQGAVEVGQDADNASVEAELLAAQNRLAQIEHALVQGARMRDEARAEVDRLVHLRDGSSGSRDNTPNAIRDYLASQTRELALRAEKVAQLKASGVDVAALAALGSRVTPLDASFARKTGYGKTRPMYNVGGDK